MRNKENRGTFRRALTAVAVTASSLVAFGVASIPAIPAASAQPTCTDSWTGTAGDGMWTTGANWNAGVPSGSSVACIQLAGTYTVTISGSASAAVLELGATSGTQTLDISGASTQSTLSLATATGSDIAGHGILELDNGSGSTLLTGGNGVTLVNDGTFETLGGSATNDYLRVNLTNDSDGTVNISGASTLQDSSTTTTNKGAFTLSSGGSLALSGSSNFTDSGGTLADKGALNLNGGTFIQSGGTESANAVVISGATLTDSAGKGSFSLVGGSDFSGTIPSGQTVTILGNSTYGQANVTATNGLVNNGTLAVDSEATSAAILAGGNGVTVTNNGTFETLGATGAIDYLRDNLINATGGTVDISGATNDQDSTTTTTNKGAFTVSSGADLDLSGSSNFTDSSGTLSNKGALNLNGGTFIQSGGTESANAVVISGATLTDSAGKGSFTLVGGSDLSGTIPSGQTVTILGNSTNGQANVTATNGLVNNGTLAVDSEATSAALLSGGNGVTVTNNGTFETLGATGAIDYLRVNLINAAAATVDISGVTTDQDSTTTTTNDGTLSVADGATLALSGGSQLVEGTTATFQPTVDATNGAFGVTGGTVSLAGTLGITTVGKPTLGQAFNVVSGSTVSGSFSGFDFGPNAYVITVGASSVTATTATPFKLTGKNVAANEDLPFSGTVATHTTGSQAGPVYTATINWGDGTGTTSGTTTKTAVTGKHNYSSTGTFTITTTLRDQFGTVETVTSTATVTLPPAPTVTLVKPASVTAGKSATLTITGTDFTTNSSVSFSNSGITVTSVTWKSASSLSVKIKVAGKAAAGAGNVSVTTPGGTGGCTSCLTVIVPPKVTSISGPLAPGAKTTVTVKGSGFETGLAVTTNITGATVGSITSVTSTSFSVSITVPSGTAPGSTYKLTVTNPDGGKVTYSKLAVS
jgi:fibronectin-binding autotransporter adhesin